MDVVGSCGLTFVVLCDVRRRVLHTIINFEACAAILSLL
jgi:hypothetical protein